MASSRKIIAEYVSVSQDETLNLILKIRVS